MFAVSRRGLRIWKRYALKSNGAKNELHLFGELSREIKSTKD
jgi:hypothetical protein